MALEGIQRNVQQDSILIQLLLIANRVQLIRLLFWI